MTDEQIKRALVSIARKEIKDDMDLWMNIEKKLSYDRRLWHVPVSILTRLAAVITLVLVSAVAYGFYQQNEIADPGLTGVQEGDLITELQLAQTQNDLTVTLDWGYADVHRIALSYSASYTGDIVVYGLSHRLTDQQGNAIPPAFGGGGGGSGGDGQPRLSQALANFDVSDIDFTDRDTIDLRLEITYGPSPAPATHSEGNFSGSSGGGGGGGGGGGTSPAVTPAPTTEIEPMTFVWDFTLPVIRAVVVEPMQLRRTNGIDITLEQIAITPSLTRARICADQLIDSEVMWIPMSSLVIPAIEEEPLSIPSTGSRPVPDRVDCYDTDYLVPFMGTTEGWTLMVERLQTPIKDYDWERIVTALREAGVEADLVDGGGFRVTNDSDAEVDIYAIIREAEDTMRDILEGPWIFEVELP